MQTVSWWPFNSHSVVTVSIGLHLASVSFALRSYKMHGPQAPGSRAPHGLFLLSLSYILLISVLIPPSMTPLTYAHTLSFLCLNRVQSFYTASMFGWFSFYFHFGLSKMFSLGLRADEQVSLVTGESEASTTRISRLQIQPIPSWGLEGSTPQKSFNLVLASERSCACPDHGGPAQIYPWTLSLG